MAGVAERRIVSRISKAQQVNEKKRIMILPQAVCCFSAMV